MMQRRGVGKPCAYCQRLMEDRASPTGLAVTRDHYHPKSKGGRKIVLACRTCNEIKGDMLPADWEAFMASFPRWWEGRDRFISLQQRRQAAKEPAYLTAWDRDGRPIGRFVTYHKPKRKATKSETQDTFAEWQKRAMRERQADARNLPYAESMMILRHGKDFWRGWKERGGPIPCDCCNFTTPKSVPIEYDDPKRQAAFEAMYIGREHLLRVRGAQH